MNDRLELIEEYQGVLTQCLVGGADRDFHQAYEWGRSALTQGISLLEVVEIQAEALAHVLETENGSSPKVALEGTTRAAREALAPYEMAYRGFREANTGLVEANRQLELSISERDTARDEAEAANLAKSDFLSRMSHELRTPLNSILGFAQLLQLAPLEADQKENVALIYRGGQHLLSLINEVLDIARIESGNMSMSIEAVRLGHVMTEVIDLVRPIAHQNDVTVEIDLPDNAEPVQADYLRLRQVLLNLLSNAIKYNRRGGAVTARAIYTDDRVRIEVVDTGLGISEFRMGRLFTAFDRLGAENSSTEGTGLGLVLSKKLVEAMGGTLDVVSVVGQGTTFTIDVARAQEQPAMGPSEQGQVGDSNLTRGTILYIEDNKANTTLVERILRLRPEVDLVTAPQGRLGLELARSQNPDLILLDLDLPDLPGDQVLRTLKAQPETASIPVVILSADATPASVQTLLGDGASTYLTKPIDVKEFLAAIDSVFRALAAFQMNHEGVSR